MDEISIYDVTIIGGGFRLVAKILSNRAAVDTCPEKDDAQVAPETVSALS